MKDIAEDKLRWGDEVECGVLSVNSNEGTVKLSCRAAKIREELNATEIKMDHLTEGCTWHPEYGAWMVSNFAVIYDAIFFHSLSNFMFL